MRRRNVVLLAFLAIILILPACFELHLSSSEIQDHVDQFKNRIAEKEEELDEILHKVKTWNQQGKLDLHKAMLNTLYEEEGFSFFIFKEGQLSYWSENSTIINKEKVLDGLSFYESNGSYYKKLLLNDNAYIYLGLIHIYDQFPIQNEYLKSGFFPDLQFPGIEHIGSNPTNYPLIESAKAEEQFFLHINPDSKSSSFQSLFLLLFFLGTFLLLYSLIHIPRKLTKYSSLYAIGLTLLLRLVLFYYLPETILNSDLFASSNLAISSFIPSIGDLILHLITLFIIVYHIGLLFKKREKRPFGIFLMLLSLLLAYLNIELVNASVSSSQLSFELNNPFSIDILNLVVLIGFCFGFISNIILAGTSINQLNLSFHSRTNGFLKIVLAVSYSIIVLFILEKSWIYLWILPASFVLDFYYGSPSGKKVMSALLLLIISSATMAYCINFQHERKEQHKTKYIAQKLAEERDPVAEYLFHNIQSKLSTDTFLINNISKYWDDKEYYDAYILNNYFDSFWNQYNIDLFLCNQEDSLYLTDSDISISCFKYFQERIRLEGDMVSSNNLFQLENLAGRIDYIGEVPLELDSIRYHIYVELSANYFNENDGYPDLLLDQNSKTHNFDLTDYSYAVYNQGRLIFHNGDYIYSITPKVNELTENEFYSYETENFHHTAYKKHKNTLIIISNSLTNFIDFFTSFAYLLICFSLLFILLAISLKDFAFYFRPNLIDFSVKIQLYFTVSLFVALILVVVGSNYYIKEQFQKKNFDNLKDKLRSINIELESKIGNEDFLPNNESFTDYVSSLLIKFSNVFYTDINLYDPNGKLYACSRPEVFEKGLKSDRMETTAFEKIVENEKSEWVQKEKIGDLEYLSAYIPFVNSDNRVISYLNLPYFVQQGKLEEEISNFLVSIINIYVGIFVISSLISLLLIDQLSRPLLLIRNKIKRLKLGSSIELIDWKSQDEIGELVKEYNRIAIELNESAERLAQSERETAWREMAKQVAHEIKNPLTPMKLSIQHLEVASNQNTPDIKERIKRTSQTLIQQIETLSNIATAFSAFAKLPDKQLSRIDLIPTLNSAIDLYSSDANIKLNLNDIKNATILADNDQLLRMFNNLLKNAIQSGKDNQAIQIEIELSQLSGRYKLEIKDNGSGIPEDKLQKIFEPNFTTKSSGMGLGLAISKKIIEQMEGEVSVNSQLGAGTTFTIYFPIA